VRVGRGSGKEEDAVEAERYWRRRMQRKRKKKTKTKKKKKDAAQTRGCAGYIYPSATKRTFPS
jgi:AMMECR1 domain-containing protein